jgi:glutamine synthetase
VKWRTYTKKIQIEARVLGDLVINHIIPVAIRYQSILLDNITKIRAVFPEEKATALSSLHINWVEEIANHVSLIKTNVDAMVEARSVANCIECEYEKALAYHDTVLPFFEVIRFHTDSLELIVDDEMWPLPKYRELLFIR